MNADDEKDKSSWKSPATRWEQSIKEIPIPRSKKNAWILILTGFSLIVVSVTSFLYYAANAPMNTTGGSVQSWVALFAFGSALIGIATMLRGIWFFLSQLGFVRTCLAIVAKFKASPWWLKFLCGFILFAASTAWCIWMMRISDTYLSSLMSWLRFGSLFLALGLALVGVSMIFAKLPSQNAEKDQKDFNIDFTDKK